MKNIRMISRILVGIVFIFSGFVKAIDPLGFTYKFGDYFTAFHIGFLEPLALPLAILLSCMEMLLGIALLLGYRMKISSWALLAFMTFFTLLTFILALTNPVHDCGCFGDALILTNWQTFWKNVIIMFFTLIIFSGRNFYPERRSSYPEWGILGLFYIGSIILSVYCYRNLPVLDFRPYSIGTYIPGSMRIPEGAPESEYETRLYYRDKESGKEKEFTMDNFPQDTLKWEFVDAHSELIKQGYEPPIHDFNIIAPDGSDITEAIIQFPGYSFLMIAYDAKRANPEALSQFNSWYRITATLPDVQFFAVSSSVRDDLDSLKKSLDLDYDFSQADEITLKTIVRSNPGLVLIKNGTIVGKWSYRQFPLVQKFPEFAEITATYPFCNGCDLFQIQQPPLGASADEYSTLLYYRNIATGEIMEFTMENFPAGNLEWVFENSVSKKVKSGFLNPLDNVSIKYADGIDYKNIALSNEGYSMLIFIKDPTSLSPAQFKSLNKFGAMAMEYLPANLDVYGVTELSTNEIMEFTSLNIPAFNLYSSSQGSLDNISGDSLRIVLLKGGKVVFQFAGYEAPEPGSLSDLSEAHVPVAETILSPFLLKMIMDKNEKFLVYIFILGFLLISMIIRLYFKQKEEDA